MAQKIEKSKRVFGIVFNSIVMSINSLNPVKYILHL